MGDTDEQALEGNRRHAYEYRWDCPSSNFRLQKPTS
jgi:hypothetical protein